MWPELHYNWHYCCGRDLVCCPCHPRFEKCYRVREIFPILLSSFLVFFFLPGWARVPPAVVKMASVGVVVVAVVVLLSLSLSLLLFVVVAVTVVLLLLLLVVVAVVLTAVAFLSLSIFPCIVLDAFLFQLS